MKIIELIPGTSFRIRLGEVFVYLHYEPSTHGINDWRASFPGASMGASTISMALLDARGLWERHGKPSLSRYCGPEPTDITLDDLLALAKPWEREIIGRIFGVYQGPLEEFSRDQAG